MTDITKRRISRSIYWMQRFIQSSNIKLKRAQVTSVKIIGPYRFDKYSDVKLVAQIIVPAAGIRDTHTTATFNLDQLIQFVETECEK